MTWQIDIEGTSPEDAAANAQNMMREAIDDEMGMVFDVLEPGPKPKRTRVDLEEVWQKQREQSQES